MQDYNVITRNGTTYYYPKPIQTFKEWFSNYMVELNSSNALELQSELSANQKDTLKSTIKRDPHSIYEALSEYFEETGSQFRERIKIIYLFSENLIQIDEELTALRFVELFHNKYCLYKLDKLCPDLFKFLMHEYISKKLEISDDLWQKISELERKIPLHSASTLIDLIVSTLLSSRSPDFDKAEQILKNAQLFVEISDPFEDDSWKYTFLENQLNKETFLEKIGDLWSDYYTKLITLGYSKVLSNIAANGIMNERIFCLIIKISHQNKISISALEESGVIPLLVNYTYAGSLRSSTILYLLEYPSIIQFLVEKGAKFPAPLNLKNSLFIYLEPLNSITRLKVLENFRVFYNLDPKIHSENWFWVFYYKSMATYLSELADSKNAKYSKILLRSLLVFRDCDEEVISSFQRLSTIQKIINFLQTTPQSPDIDYESFFKNIIGIYDTIQPNEEHSCFEAVIIEELASKPIKCFENQSYIDLADRFAQHEDNLASVIQLLANRLKVGRHHNAIALSPRLNSRLKKLDSITSSDQIIKTVNLLLEICTKVSIQPELGLMLFESLLSLLRIHEGNETVRLSSIFWESCFQVGKKLNAWVNIEPDRIPIEIKKRMVTERYNDFETKVEKGNETDITFLLTNMASTAESCTELYQNRCLSIINKKIGEYLTHPKRKNFKIALELITDRNIISFYDKRKQSPLLHRYGEQLAEKLLNDDLKIDNVELVIYLAINLEPRLGTIWKLLINTLTHASFLKSNNLELQKKILKELQETIKKEQIDLTENRYLDLKKGIFFLAIRLFEDVQSNSSEGANILFSLISEEEKTGDPQEFKWMLSTLIEKLTKAPINTVNQVLFKILELYERSLAANKPVSIVTKSTIFWLVCRSETTPREIKIKLLEELLLTREELSPKAYQLVKCECKQFAELAFKKPGEIKNEFFQLLNRVLEKASRSNKNASNQFILIIEAFRYGRLEVYDKIIPLFDHIFTRTGLTIKQDQFDDLINILFSEDIYKSNLNVKIINQIIFFIEKSLKIPNLTLKLDRQRLENFADAMVFALFARSENLKAIGKSTLQAVSKNISSYEWTGYDETEKNDLKEFFFSNSEFKDPSFFNEFSLEKIFKGTLITYESLNEMFDIIRDPITDIMDINEEIYSLFKDGIPLDDLNIKLPFKGLLQRKFAKVFIEKMLKTALSDSEKRIVLLFYTFHLIRVFYKLYPTFTADYQDLCLEFLLTLNARDEILDPIHANLSLLLYSQLHGKFDDILEFIFEVILKEENDFSDERLTGKHVLLERIYDSLVTRPSSNSLIRAETMLYYLSNDNINKIRFVNAFVEYINTYGAYAAGQIFHSASSVYEQIIDILADKLIKIDCKIKLWNSTWSYLKFLLQQPERRNSAKLKAQIEERFQVFTQIFGSEICHQMRNDEHLSYLKVEGEIFHYLEKFTTQLRLYIENNESNNSSIDIAAYIEVLLPLLPERSTEDESKKQTLTLIWKDITASLKHLLSKQNKQKNCDKLIKPLNTFILAGVKRSIYKDRNSDLFKFLTEILLLPSFQDSIPATLKEFRNFLTFYWCIFMSTSGVEYNQEARMVLLETLRNQIESKNIEELVKNFDDMMSKFKLTPQ